MPGSHRDCELDLERAEVGVSIAPAEAARREAGGIVGIGTDGDDSVRSE